MNVALEEVTDAVADAVVKIRGGPQT